MKVFLVRHAEAAGGDPDELRPLTPTGREQARALGARLRESGVQADAVVTSPLLRARETGALLARALETEAAADDRLSPGATRETLVDAVAGRGETVVAVGHQPDCSRIVAAVNGGPEPDFPPAGAVALEL
jgi:phosphohistidine phosphatase SixA